MLHIPTRFRLRVDTSKATNDLMEQIAKGELLLERPFDAVSALGPFRRDVRRWQVENDAVIETILERLAEPPPSADASAGGVASDNMLFELLKDEVAEDVAKLNGLLVRVRGGIGSTTVPGAVGRAASPPVEQPVRRPWGSDPGGGVDSDFGPMQLADDELTNAPSERFTRAADDGPTSYDDADVREEHAVDEPTVVRTLVRLADPESVSLAQYDADAVSTQDLIGNDQIVDAFAYLIAATALQPPLAIGLFGHWGTGKSFLMRSIQRRIDDITLAARESERHQADIGVYQRVVQIEFNAWHYVEGNLWASMVDHILSNLRTSSEDDTSDLDRRRKKVTQTLASTRQEQQNLSARIDVLTTRRHEAESEAAELRNRQQDELEKIGRLRLKDVAVAATLTSDDKTRLTDALTRVGVSGLPESAADAASSLADARQVVQRGNLLVAPMRQHGWGWAALLVGVTLLAPALAFLLEQLHTSSVTQVLTAVAGFLSAAALVLRHSTSWVGTTLDKIESAERQVRQRVEQAAEGQAEALARHQQEVDGLERQLAEVSRRREEVTSEIRALNDELRDLTPGKLLASFLDERAASSDYRKHLGLTALVRRDFEELSRLVAAYNADALLADGTATTAPGAEFNRIVLYIDDLDRCPPHRVVEVLQAVHLLLSFPVFVVLVAVDPRWLAQSLEAEYDQLLRSNDDDGNRGQAAPRDYLEKIFQIPFNVAPLDLVGRARFVEGLLGPEVVPAVGAGAAGTGDGDGRLQVAEDAEDVVRSAEEPAATTAPGSGDEAPPDHGPETAADQPVSAPVDALAGAEEDEGLVDLSPGRLRFSAAELTFLQSLLPLLDTSPRSLKRYVNLYRLIKVVAGVALPDGTAVHSGRAAPHEAAMFLLAVQTGLPTAGPGLVARVGLADGTGTVTASRLVDVVDEMSAHLPGDRRQQELTTVWGWLTSHPDAESWTTADLAPFARHVRLYSFT